MTIHCFTSASFSYLDRVRILGKSLKRQHPDWVFSLCLSDTEPPDFVFDIANEPIDNLVRIEELGIPDLKGWIFQHNVVELCTAVKGHMLCRLLEQGADKVVYLDPDIAIFSSLSDVISLLDTMDVVLTPHLVSPQITRFGVEADEIGSLKHGVYNLGFVAVANRNSGIAYARWWRDRLLDYCFDDIPNGLFTDQRWCDLVPALFDNVYVLRDPGYNVASWNLEGRPMQITDDGAIQAGGVPLRFFHFTKITSVGEAALINSANGNLAVMEVMKWYCSTLSRYRVEGLPTKWWAFSTYDNGRPIEQKHRIAYRKNPSLRTKFPDPFTIDEISIEAFFS